MSRTPTQRGTFSRRDALKLFGGALTLPLLDRLGVPLLAGEPSKTHADDLALRFAKFYKPVKVNVTPRIKAYDLPLDLSKVANYKQVAQVLGLPDDEPSLKANGFTVVPGKGNEDIVAPYDDMKKRQVPIFITTDTLLHLYHVQFDETLKDIEEREFYPDIVALAKALTADIDGQKLPQDTEDYREARKKAVTYLAAGVKALDPKAELPKHADPKDVALILDKMAEHKGFWPDPEAAEKEWPLFRYAEDFSQYVPRGHYTRSETLKKYFVGMMWFGRMTFLLKGDDKHGPATITPALVSVVEANQQTLAAAMLTRALENVQLPDKRKAGDVWERIYVVTAFYVGLADDLGRQQYKTALAQVCGAALDLAALGDAGKMQALRQELAKHKPPAIYSGTGNQGSFIEEANPGDLVKALDKSTGFRLMGQRFIPDSYMMGKLVYPTIGPPTRGGIFTRVETDAGPIRGFPRGLDVMAILGSKRARDLLKELGDDAYAGGGKALSYDDALKRLTDEYGKLSDVDWNRNMYWSWLHALKPLLAECGAGYQAFMQTKAYRTKSLNTALASWAQLRHDTILYAKQSYTMRALVKSERVPVQLKPVQGYVEPVPEFYARLLALLRMTNQGLTDMKVLDQEAKDRLNNFEKLLERLLAIVEKELDDKELTEQDYEFIRNIADQLKHVSVKPNQTRIGELAAQLNKESDANKREALRNQIAVEQSGGMKTTLVADVHTDSNSKEVLEEGTGYVDLGVFVYLQPDGRLVAGAGPVFSYHEFKHPMRDRLTDEKWRELLKKPDAPKQPEWTVAYTCAKATYSCPEARD